MLVMTGGRLLSIRSSVLTIWAIPRNPGGGHRGQESEGGWHGLDSHGGVTSASIAAMTCVAVAAGLPSLQVVVTTWS